MVCRWLASLALLFLALSSSKEDDDWCGHRWHQRVCAEFDNALCQASTQEYETRCGSVPVGLLGEAKADNPLDKPALEVLEAKAELMQYKKKSKEVVEAIFRKLARCEAQAPISIQKATP